MFSIGLRGSIDLIFRNGNGKLDFQAARLFVAQFCQVFYA